MEVLTLVLSVIGAISGFVLIWNLIVQYVRDRSFYRLFPKHSDIIITCSTRRSSNEAVNIPTTVEDSLAQASVQVAFTKYGIAHRVKLHNHLTHDEKVGNLFLIAGLRSNVIMAELNEAGLLPFRFTPTPTGGHIIVNRANQKMHPDTQPGVYDYAIVGILKNPWAPPESSARIYFAAGLDGLGTWAAATQLVEKPRHLCRYLKAHDISTRSGFEALLKASSLGALSPSTSIGEVVPLQA